MRVEGIYDGLVEMRRGSGHDLGEAGLGGFDCGLDGLVDELGLLDCVLDPRRRFAKGFRRAVFAYRIVAVRWLWWCWVRFR